MTNHGEQCRKQRNGRNHHDGNANCHGDGESTDESKSNGQQPEKSHNDSDASEQHCTSRCVNRFNNRIFHRHSVVKCFAVSRHDEERVVNTYTEANHGHHGSCFARH